MYSRLKGLLVEKRIAQQELAQMLNITASALNFKINGRNDKNTTEFKDIVVCGVCKKALGEN